MQRHVDVPDLLPVLARGKHRTPASGGCFMEFASYLAGERWSDHPACTHPLVASLARLVNDAVSDDHRPELAPLVPMVVGLHGDGLQLDALVARRCAVLALPMAPPDDQRALAVAVLTAERMLAAVDARPEGLLSEEAEAALASAPEATTWARELSDGRIPSARAYRKHAAPTAVRCAVQGILAARRPDQDRVLHDLLAAVIDDCLAWLEPEVRRVDHRRWHDGCALLEGSVGR